jgi:starch-binding outer membrane protein, SusD/RagB family
MPTMTKRINPTFLVGLVMAVAAVGCQDLDVANPNNPDRARALAVPGDVETLISSAWYPYWNRTQVNGTVYHPLNAISSIQSTSVANNSGLELSEIPRPVYDNNPASGPSGLARFPWYDFYTGLDSGSEGLRAIDGGLQIGVGGEDTQRATAWAKFGQGLNLGMLGLFYDQAIIATEDTDLEDPTQLEFRPYPEVIDAAVAAFEEAADLARSNSFTIPGEWFRLVGGLDSDRLARIAHSMAARKLVLSARYPEDREALDWNRVIAHIDQGIQEDVFVDHNRDELGSANYQRRVQENFFNGFFFIQFFLAYADVSGNSQEWLSLPIQERTRVHIVTPDARLQANSDSMSGGKYTIYRRSNNFRDERGTWRQSYYQLRRWLDENGRVIWRDGPLLIMSVDEMELYRAEGYARMGRRDEAAAILNSQTRVPNGELPPVTADGVPQSPDCAPRYYDGSCMGLLDAIIYDRIVETTGMDATRDWMEARGWGHLYEGTFVHLPVPGRELETLDLPIYTFGGGGPGSAP